MAGRADDVPDCVAPHHPAVVVHIKFLVAAHSDPMFLARLCERLRATPDSSVTVQWDCAFAPPDLDARLANVRPTSSPCEWGSGRQLDALLSSLWSIGPEQFDWLVLVSGRDYPIRPGAELRETLENTSHQLFLLPEEGPLVVPGPDTPAYLGHRYFYRYRWFPQRWWSILPQASRRVLGAGAKRAAEACSPGGSFRVQRRPGDAFSPGLGHRVRAHPFTADRPCWKGSDWFVISRPVFDDLLSEIRSSPELVEYFRRTYCPSEAFFHTILFPHWRGANAGHNLHYVRFVGNRAHPETIVVEDWEAMVESRAFFARKFDPADTAFLDRIDRELLDWTSRARKT